MSLESRIATIVTIDFIVRCFISLVVLIPICYYVITFKVIKANEMNFLFCAFFAAIFVLFYVHDLNERLVDGNFARFIISDLMCKKLKYNNSNNKYTND